MVFNTLTFKAMRMDIEQKTTALQEVRDSLNKQSYFESGQNTELLASSGKWHIDSLLNDSNGQPLKWESDPFLTDRYSINSSTVISYSFPGLAQSSSLFNYEDDVGPIKAISFNNQQIIDIRNSLDTISDYINVTFIEVSEIEDKVGTLRFGINTITDETGAHRPGIVATADPPNIEPRGGDIWFNTNFSNVNFGAGLAVGSQTDAGDLAVLYHEIFHALGLEHPNDNKNIPFPEDKNFREYTVMADEFATDGTTHYRSGEIDYTVISSPMVYDIVALQYLYGANKYFNGDATTYKFDPDRPFITTIWDSGGLDTIDLSNFDTDNILDLEPGAYSTIVSNNWSMSKNFGIAFNVIIENALGGLGSDYISGNTAANLIAGNSGDDTIDGKAGDDVIEGGLGNDTLTGGAGSDIFRYSKGDGNDTILDFNSAIDSMEFVSFSAQEKSKFVEVVAENGDREITLSDGSILMLKTMSSVILTNPIATRTGLKMSDVAIAYNSENDTTTVLSGSDGVSMTSITSGSDVTISGSLDYDISTKSITSQDALDTLRLSVGMGIQNGSNTAFDYIAADFNQDGKVSSQDALAILKYAVRLPTSEQAEWVFVDTNGNYSDISRANTNYNTGISIGNLASTIELSLTGILIGDVNDSYSGLIASTATLTDTNVVPTGVPTITGTLSQGRELSVDTSGIADADGLGDFSYQWNRDNAAIEGATASNYTLTEADVGTNISVTVLYTDGYGAAESVVSAETSKIANTNDAPTGALVINGTAAEGETLTLDTSSIADEDGLSAFSITWLSDDIPINGANETTYTLTAADVAKLVSARVSYLDLHGTEETLISSDLFVTRYDLSSLAHTVGGSTHISGLSSVVTEKYDGYPTFLNGEFDFTNLEIDYSKLEFSSINGPQYSLSSGYTGMVYYGNSGDLTGDGTPEMVLSGWTVNSDNASGRIFIVEFSDNQISNFVWRENEGTAAPWVYDFDGDGRAEILSVGFYDFPVAPAETVFFDENLEARTVVGPRIDSHESSVVDFDGDGDLDVVAISYNSVNGLISLYRNNGSGFDHEYLPKDYQGYYTSGSSIEYADLDGDGRGEFIIGDFAGNGADGGLAILKLADDNSASWDEGSEEILTIRPYFESTEFDDINSLFTSLNPYATEAEIAKYRSHDIVLKAIDIDGDGDLDLINSTQIWHDLTPFGVLQILINDGAGNFDDQTNSRLINYSLQSGGAHDLIFIDVNNDGFVDILNPEGGGHNSEYFNNGYGVDFAQHTEANSILLNDGTGHFLKIMTAPFSRPGTFSEDGFFYPNKWYPIMNDDGTLGFVQLDHAWTNYPNGEYDVINYAHLDQILFTGPKFVNPSNYGVPGFNEFYVLRNNTEVQNMVKAGSYGSALEWYLKTNPQDVNTFAMGAQVVGSTDDDVIILREGDETALGYGGNDVIHALGGDDVITGGKGADTFVFASDQSYSNHNTVTDFVLEDGDRLDLSAFGIDTVSDAMSLAIGIDSGTIISLTEIASVTLLGVEVGNLAADQSWIA
jgi:serralysin